ncbi:hypothetical protein C0993_007377 [Termitomyces sp. T159_Od127]|nr:hypothetical protein C0993_007377 [Termitomyces sp. T159_Od127]
MSGARAAVEATIEELKLISSTELNQTGVQANITETMLVPLKDHHAISQQGNLFRKLRSFGVQVGQSRQPYKSAGPTKPSSPSASTVRIDEDEEEAASRTRWEVVLNYQDTEEGDSTWTLKAHDQAGPERAQNSTEEACPGHFLTLPDSDEFFSSTTMADEVMLPIPNLALAQHLFTLTQPDRALQGHLC